VGTGFFGQRLKKRLFERQVAKSAKEERLDDN
jgi:hypothetical protein